MAGGGFVFDDSVVVGDEEDEALGALGGVEEGLGVVRGDDFVASAVEEKNGETRDVREGALLGGGGAVAAGVEAG